jgi:hypothetical protein
MSHYPQRVMLLEITPEPDDAERKAIVSALEAEGAERPVDSEWNAVFFPSLNEGEP